jgi:hypothetical protein
MPCYRECNLRVSPYPSVMSENGPREGTRDLPRPDPEARQRGVDDDSTAGVAYGTLSRSLRRRRAELVALIEAGAHRSTVAVSYQLEHPLEPTVTNEEIDAAVAEAKGKPTRNSMRVVGEWGSEIRK